MAYRYFHVVMGSNTKENERELERLSAEGWEVCQFAITPIRSGGDYDFVYLLRKPA